MKVLDKNTEKKILDAAKTVFIKKGFDGARMQEIADEAIINKALLHYYFRNKDKLFDAIFSDAFVKFIPKIGETMLSQKHFFDKIKLLVESYIDMLTRNPHIPIFILHEINRNPQRIIQILSKGGANPEMIFKVINTEIKKGTIIPVKPQHLIVNIIALCIFPYAGRPVIQGFIFKNNNKTYQKFLKERKTEVSNFIINAIKKK
ncbi:MAG: TetR/AcrR family transcriptional regulator [Bacteroidia bacterium]|nr:TetR/AcrR family transcriptional regulator [Bacteroidia bacterium]